MALLEEQRLVSACKDLEVLSLQPACVRLLNQTRLPQAVEWVEITTAQAMAEAITTMIVRGAPAIGIAGAYGLVLSAREAFSQGLQGEAFYQKLLADEKTLRASRPTAVNLMWALDALLVTIHQAQAQALPLTELIAALETQSTQIQTDDLAANKAMGAYGANLLPQNCTLLTHCNAGALATAGYGTALGVVRAAWEQGKLQQVFADETRPRLQGAKLTAWELAQDGIPVTVITDGMSGMVMRQKGGQKGITAVVVGADRIAANGDTANKIGTYNLALVAKAHNVPFYVVAPTSTLDVSLATGEEIPIEERCSSEIWEVDGQAVGATEGVSFYNPGFDVTPAELISAIITEKGVATPPFEPTLQGWVHG